MQIITLTLNPAFDVHCDAPAFAPFSECLATITSRDAGGKGVNISRALTENGIRNLALVVLGEENAADFRRALAAEGIDAREISVVGRIRENITLHTKERETRISFAGFSASDALLLRVEEALAPLLEADTIVTLTGRIPDGVSMTAIKGLLAYLRDRGARIVIDSKSFSLSELVDCRPWLIKPNEEEISHYLNRRVDTLANAADAACALRDRGIENVMVSLGGEGAVLACAEGILIASAPRIEVCSTVGAGDSAIAGFLAATACGEGSEGRLCRAVAFGSAACLRAGTQAPLAEDVQDLLPLISIQ